MSTDITALTTNVGNLDEYTDKNEKQEQDRKEKDEQLNDAIEKKVKKEEHKRERPKSRDGTIKECKKLFKEGASPAVLTKLEKSLIGQKKYHEYYVQCFLPVLDKKVKQSEEISSEIKDQVGQVISEITYDSKYYFNSIVRSQVEDNTRVETSNGITNTGVQLLKAIEKRNNSKFKKFLKESLKKCTDISNINNEEGKNILHLITSLEGKLKSKFLGTLTKTVTKENLTQLIDGENQGKTPLQEALINKVTKGKHESHTIGSNDNILKFVVALLKHGAKPDQLELSQKILQSLDEKQKSYYLKFLEKLEEPVRQSTLEQKVDIKNKIKEVAAHAINTTDSNGNYLLHSAIDNDDKKLKRFKHLLEKGADIRLKDVNGNNALHLIVTKLKRGQKLEFLKILPEACQEEHFTKVINDKNNNNQTPLHQLLQHMQEKSKKSSPINTDKYKALELFLQNDADITTQDKKGNNALHYITSFEGNQKVTCLELILKLSQNNASLKAQLREAIKATNREGKTPLQKLLFSKVTKEEHSSKSVPRKFVKFLKKPFTEYDDNAMEAIIRLFELGANVDDLQLSKEELQELDKGHWKYYLEFLEKLAESVKETEKAQIEKIITHTINTPDSNGNHLLHSAINKYDEKLFEKLLEKGADIRFKDANDDNALHRIALLKKEHKITYLKRILEEEGKRPKKQLSEAINATNKEGKTPLQIALIAKVVKDNHKLFNPESCDNTIKFCAMLLQNGAKPDDLKLTKELHNKEHYRFLYKLEKFDSIPQEIREKITKIRKDFKTRYGHQSKAKEFFKSVCESLDPARRTRELLAIIITTTVVAMAAFAFFQGQVEIGAAVSIIAIAGVICLTLTLGFSGIKKLFEDSSDKVKSFNDQQNLGNDFRGLVVKEQQSQSKDTESPSSKMQDTYVKPHGGFSAGVLEF